MKVEIIDNEVLGSFIPSELKSYLIATHWREVRREEKLVSIWEYESVSGNKYRVWLPLDPTLADYATAVGRLIKNIALVENRSQLQIAEDLGGIAIGDVIRTTMWDELNRGSNSIPISEGLLLFKRSYDLAHAAAWATVEKRPVFPYRSPAKVTKYMENLRLGQTEPGSYIMKLISPIQQIDDESIQKSFDLPISQNVIPFERQVVMNLVRSLNALREVALEAHLRGRFYFKPFEEIVSEGVSANLCEAVIGSVNKERRYYPVNVSVSWAYVLASPNIPSETISFTKDLMPYIVQAAEAFREHNPEEVSLKGYVVALSRPQIDEPGSIRVLGRVNGEKRSVRITLIGDAYNTALRAHGEDLLVECKGELIKQGNFFFLNNPFDFHVVGEMSDEIDKQLNLFE